MERETLILSLYAIRYLNEDCRQLVFDTVPFRIWTRCEGCGYILIMSDGRGCLHVSDDAKNSFDMCYMCYNTCQV